MGPKRGLKFSIEIFEENVLKMFSCERCGSWVFYFHDLVRMLDIIQCELLTSQLISIVAFLSKYAKLTSMYKSPVLIGGIVSTVVTCFNYVIVLLVFIWGLLVIYSLMEGLHDMAVRLESISNDINGIVSI